MSDWVSIREIIGDLRKDLSNAKFNSTRTTISMFLLYQFAEVKVPIEPQICVTKICQNN